MFYPFSWCPSTHPSGFEGHGNVADAVPASCGANLKRFYSTRTGVGRLYIAPSPSRSLSVFSRAVVSEARNTVAKFSSAFLPCCQQCSRKGNLSARSAVHKVRDFGTNFHRISSGYPWAEESLRRRSLWYAPFHALEAKIRGWIEICVASNIWKLVEIPYKSRGRNTVFSVFHSMPEQHSKQDLRAAFEEKICSTSFNVCVKLKIIL